MDRQTVYPGAIPLDTDILSLQRNAMVALGYALQACVGTGTVADGLACTPTAPPSMVVNVGQGSIIALETIDATTWGSLAADTNPLVKIGINAEGVTPFTLTAPGTSGKSINYLIEAAFLEADVTPVTLPYYNACNPAQPYSGPGNTGTAQDTQRTQSVQLQLKAGTAANTGTQTTPAVDAGWVGLWVVTVNYGMSTITSAAIAEHPAAPFVAFKLPALAPGFTREVTITAAGAWSWTPPPGVVRARLHLQGAGGGGGGTSNANSAGGGGGGGGYGRVVVTVTPGARSAVRWARAARAAPAAATAARRHQHHLHQPRPDRLRRGGRSGHLDHHSRGRLRRRRHKRHVRFFQHGERRRHRPGYGTAFGGGQGGCAGDGRGGCNQLSQGAPASAASFRARAATAAPAPARPATTAAPAAAAMCGSSGEAGGME